MYGDPYTDPETGVLRNRLGITDSAELFRVEGRLATIALFELAERPEPGDYDLAHLQRVHRRVFGEIFDWAGEVRTVDIAKPGSPFCPARTIESYAPQVFGEIERRDDLGALTPGQAIQRLPRYLAEVNALHPFREGNGRAQRAFFSQWAGETGVRLDWTGLDPGRNIVASQQSFRGNLEPLTHLVNDHATIIERPRQVERDRGPDLGR